MHRASHGAARRALQQRRSVVARAVVLAIVSPALLMLASTTADAAIVKPFASVFSANTNGQIILRGNTNETCDTVNTGYTPNPPTPPIGSTACAEAQKGGDGFNNQFNMKYVDIDGVSSTFNSSSATVDIPSGSRVLYARLSWSGTRTGSTASNGAPETTKSNQVKVQGPGGTGYTTVTAAAADVTTAGNSNAYGAAADVTTFVAAAGAGSYTVADIQAGLGSDRYAGWSMAIAYANPTEPVRNLTIFNGWGTVTNGETLNIPVSGFQTPPNGTVDTRVGVAAFEGDRGLTGDQLSIDGHDTNGVFTKLNNAVNPEGNTFNSTVSQTGVAVTGRNPGYDNTLGEDVDRFNASGILKNGQTSTTLRLTSSGDTYYPQTVTFATELYAPKLSSTKTATDVNGGNLEPGDQIEYAIDVKNDGLDDAKNSRLSDAIPANTTYVPASLRVGGTQVTDAGDGDVGRFVDDGNQGEVRANLGTGASGTAGGSLAVNGTGRVVFRVTVDDDVDTETTIPNTASVSYEGGQTGLLLSSSSNTASTAVTGYQADMRVRATADQAVVQRGATAAYTVEVVNRGPKRAGGVQVANALPAGATVSSISTDQGTCSTTDASCDLGFVTVGATVTIHLVVTLPANAADPSAVTSTVSARTVDPNAANDTSTASVGVNSPPTATGTSATTVDGKATVEVLRNASDPDGDTLSVVRAVVQPPTHGTVVINMDGTVGYTADPGFVGTDTIVYTISDGRGGTTTATLTVTVPNAAPVAKNDETAAAPTGATSIDVLANDTDANPGDTLTIGSVTQPVGGAVTIAADRRTVVFTPTRGFKGSTTFSYTVDDGHGGTDSATVTVTVPNTGPVAANDDYTSDYATGKLLDVLADDRDDNDDALTIVRGSVSDPMSGGASVGTAVIEDGKIRFVPQAGFSGAATFDYTITDGTATSTATVTVTVGNGVPTAGNGAVTIDGGKTTQIDVLQHAADPNGDPLRITGISSVAHGSVVLNADGTVASFTPATGYKGSASFDYTVSDGNGGSATGTIDVTVSNQPPTALDVRRTAPSGTTITVPVLNGASDPNGDAVTLSDVSQPLHGTRTFDPARGTITYTSEDGYEGSEVLTFTVSDGDGGTVQRTLTVRAINVAPVATPDTTTTHAQKGGSVALDVLANDTDANGDALTVSGVTAPAGGTATISADGKQIAYTYPDDYSGTDVFTYTVSDGRGGETTGAVTVTVVNDPPVANPDSVTIARNATTTVDVVADDTDPNGDTLELVGVDDPTDAQGDVAGTTSVRAGKVLLTPTPGFTGTVTASYRVRDARGAVSTGTLTVDVADTAPTARDVAATTPYDMNVTVTPDATDPDGDALTLTALGQPEDTGHVVRGSVTIVGGKAVYDPPVGFSGLVSFAYTVSDGLQTASATMRVTVGNGAPELTGGTTQSVTATGTPDPITTTDPNGDTVTVTVVGGALPGGLTLNADGTFTRTGPSAPGTWVATLQVCDDRTPRQCEPGLVTITVDDTAPTAGDVAVTTSYDETKTIDVIRTGQNPAGVATDPDSDTLTLTGVAQPRDAANTARGDATIVSGKVVFDPPAGFSGTVTFSYTVSDGTKTTSGTVTVTVGNGAPTFTGGTQQTIGARGTPTRVTTTDPNGDPVTLTVPATGLPPGLTLGSAGTWTGAATTPGSYTVTVQACDDRTPRQCTPATITIVVENTRPVAGDDAVTVDYGSPVAYDVFAPRLPVHPNGLAHDLDLTDTPTLTDVTQARDAGGTVVGTVTRRVDGTVTFTPPNGFSGTVTIRYTISDNDAYAPESASGTLTVTVGNGTPTVTGGTTQQVQKSKAPAPLALKDPNGDPMTVTVVGGRIPTGLTLDPDGTWTGATTQAGSFVSTVQVCDNRTPAACSTHDVTIAVDDSAPVARNDTRSTPAGTTIVIPVQTNDSDPDADPLTVTRISTPVDGKGRATGRAAIVDGKISYVPPVGFRGPVTLTYTLTDGTQDSTATVTVVVANASPKVTDGVSQKIATGAAPTRVGTADPNGDVTSVRVVDGRIPPGLALGTDGTWSGTATTAGTFVSTVEVCDDQTPAACTTQAVTVRVTPAAATGVTDSGPSAGGSPAQSVVDNGILPSTGSSAVLPWAGLAGLVLIALGGGLALRRRREADTEPRSGPRPVGGRRRPGSRRGGRGTGMWLDLRAVLAGGGLRPATAGPSVTPGRHQGGRHRHG